MIRQLAAAVRERRVGAHELVSESLRRIETCDPELNAVVALRAEEALEEARGLDEHLASGGGEPRPLAGIPALIKDLTDVAGMRTTFGSRLYAHAAPAARDGLPTARLRAAGAVIVGKTNTPEFATEGYTNNHVFGPTRNPWNRERTPGGSSGGSGAVVAAGMAPIATATDTSGSIRIPATYCGLVGLKPTNGIVAREPETRTTLEWIDLTTDGPLGATVDDVVLQLEVLAGPSPGDPTALPWVWHHERAGSRRPHRLFVAQRWAPEWGALPDGTRALLEEAVEKMAMLLRLEPEPIDAAAGLGEIGSVDDDSFLITAVELLQALGGAEGFARVKDELFPATVELVEPALDAGADAYVAARRRRLAYTRWFDELLGDDAVLLGAVMATDAIAAEGPSGGAGSTGDAYLTAPHNLTGNPALSLPAGRYPSGVPFGLQVTGPRFGDDLLLDIAAAWEEAHPWHLAAEGYEPFRV
jgi:Asp-tRNA(Asn)/Glu-tRNA(Gln) amidotransferase A subunit family amidase